MSTLHGSRIDLRALVRRKYSNIKVILRAYRDGVHENMGKTVEPGAF